MDAHRRETLRYDSTMVGDGSSTLEDSQVCHAPRCDTCRLFGDTAAVSVRLRAGYTTAPLTDDWSVS